MAARNRRMVLFVFIAMMLINLACTLGGSDAPTETETPTLDLTPTELVLVSPTSETIEPTLTETPAGTATSTPTATATAIVGSGPGGCVLDGQYIADVTIPDGTQLAPNAAFVKTWRIRNDGTCNWDSSYQLVYAQGTQMSSPAAVNIPAAAPGQTVDISVNLVAPSTPGDYVGTWRLRASNNAIFGGYTAVIKVVGTPTPTPSSTPTATPSASVTLTGGGIWGGTWETSCEASTCGNMNLVQTGNTVAGTYADGAGVINGTVSGNRLAGTWTRGGSSGSFDFWIEGSNKRWHGSYDKSFGWCGRRAGESYLSPCSVTSWYGTWTTNCSLAACGDMILQQSGDTVNGTYASGDGTVNGTVNGVELTGTWSRGNSNGSFKFYMQTNGTQFRGNYDTSNAWCGYRNAAGDPATCLQN